MTREGSLRDLEHEVSVLIRRVKRVIVERAHAVHPDIAPASYLMLAYIAENGPVRASAMAELFTIDKGAVSRQVGHLFELGLLESAKDPADGRASLLTASADAVLRMEDAKIHRRKIVDERLGDWSAADLEGFAADLARYNASLNDA